MNLLQTVKTYYYRFAILKGNQIQLELVDTYQRKCIEELNRRLSKIELELSMNTDNLDELINKNQLVRD